MTHNVSGPTSRQAGRGFTNITVYTVEQHIALKRVSDLAPSPDGRWLAVAVQRLDRDGARYVSDLWKVPTDGSPATQLTRGDSKDGAPCFRHDGALCFLSNRQPNEVKPDEDAEKRMQVWCLPAGGGEPVMLTDEPLGVEAFRCAERADRMVLLAPVLADVPHDKQRETAAERAKKGPSARRYSRQPVRHWDHWLHQNEDFAFTHVIACDAGGRHRVDLTPGAQHEFAIEPAFDLSPDGRLVAVTRQTAGADRELTLAGLRTLERPTFWPDSRSVLLAGEADAGGWDLYRVRLDGTGVDASGNGNHASNQGASLVPDRFGRPEPVHRGQRPPPSEWRQYIARPQPPANVPNTKRRQAAEGAAQPAPQVVPRGVPSLQPPGAVVRPPAPLPRAVEAPQPPERARVLEAPRPGGPPPAVQPPRAVPAAPRQQLRQEGTHGGDVRPATGGEARRMAPRPPAQATELPSSPYAPPVVRTPPRQAVPQPPPQSPVVPRSSPRQREVAPVATPRQIDAPKPRQVDVPPPRGRAEAATPREGYRQSPRGGPAEPVTAAPVPVAPAQAAPPAARPSPPPRANEGERRGNDRSGIDRQISR